MKLLKSFIISASIMMLVLGLSAHLAWADESEHGSEEKSHEESFEKGPNGGRLLKNGDISLELLIFERGMEPHFRAYVYKNGKIVSPTNTKLTITLTRFNHKNDKITFVPIDNFLQSNQIVEEPHSFDVALQLDLEGKQYAWQYSSYEGRLKMVPALLKSANIQTSSAQSQTIKTQLKVVGKIVPNRDTLTPIYARYEGIIKSMTKNLGDEVNKGDALATIESNESLQNYLINAPMTGTVVQKSATNGELARNTKPLYEIANLANVWADFTLYRKEAPLIKQGMQITVTGDEGKPESSSTISYIAPLGIEDSQTTLARAVIPNDPRVWLPGMYVNGAITIKEKTVPVAILLSAIQKINDEDVIFVQQGDYFEATPIILGEKDEQWVEVVTGIEAGQKYVSHNSFFMKAELGKNGASHEH